jgi:hypothetical protein
MVFGHLTSVREDTNTRVSLSRDISSPHHLNLRYNCIRSSDNYLKTFRSLLFSYIQS